MTELNLSERWKKLKEKSNFKNPTQSFNNRNNADNRSQNKYRWNDTTKFNDSTQSKYCCYCK
ncbi:hypothetical protein I7I48_00010 [Histoplasma ohiense]|nr:hypothetical protein I7I48_00010 [Histoplasma ohiense (nom. inval.)]